MSEEKKPAKSIKTKRVITVIEPYFDQEIKKEMDIGDVITTTDKRAKQLIDLNLVK